MAKKSKIVQMAEIDMPLACVVEDDVEADFFLRGLRDSARAEQDRDERAAWRRLRTG